MKELLTLLVLAVAGHVALGVLVLTKYGAVQGQSHTLHDGRQVNSFLGIPFAKPPVGKLRFKAPEDPEPWTETLKGNKITSACFQYRSGQAPTHRGWSDYSEDCLHLNVYTPKDMSRGPYPVLVWIYGGGYATGAHFMYPGYFLASRDVVVVVPNYRLNGIGFASTHDSVAPGNYGLRDQVKALEFVRDNIRNFGGDPNKVTIAGQSAGGSSVGLLNLSPLAQGLFHQAIYQSGTDLAFWALQGPEESSWRYTDEMARVYNCPTTDHVAMMDCLREVPAEKIATYRPLNCTAGYTCGSFSPVVDGTFLPAHPHILRNQSKFAMVKTMIGMLEQDGSIHAATYPGIQDGMTREQFETFIREDLQYSMVGHEDKVDDVYNAVRFFYTPWEKKDENNVYRDQFVDMYTDMMFGYPAELLMRYGAKLPAIYNYVIKYKSSKITDVIPKWMGATHGFDFPYMLGYNYMRRTPSVRDESGFTHDWLDWTPEDDNMADLMMDMWTNFVKTGNPTPAPIAMPGETPTLWKAYNQETKQTFVIDTKLSHETRYRQKAYALFSQYLDYLLKK